MILEKYVCRCQNLRVVSGGKTGYDRAMKRTGRSEKQKFRRSNKHDEFKN